MADFGTLIARAGFEDRFAARFSHQNNFSWFPTEAAADENDAIRIAEDHFEAEVRFTNCFLSAGSGCAYEIVDYENDGEIIGWDVDADSYTPLDYW